MINEIELCDEEIVKASKIAGLLTISKIMSSRIMSFAPSKTPIEENDGIPDTILMLASIFFNFSTNV